MTRLAVAKGEMASSWPTGDSSGQVLVNLRGLEGVGCVPSAIDVRGTAPVKTIVERARAMSAKPRERPKYSSRALDSTS
jgi:hypothetical protein